MTTNETVTITLECAECGSYVSGEMDVDWKDGVSLRVKPCSECMEKEYERGKGDAE